MDRPKHCNISHKNTRIKYRHQVYFLIKESNFCFSSAKMHWKVFEMNKCIYKLQSCAVINQLSDIKQYCDSGTLYNSCTHREVTWNWFGAEGYMTALYSTVWHRVSISNFILSCMHLFLIPNQRGISSCLLPMDPKDTQSDVIKQIWETMLKSSLA